MKVNANTKAMLTDYSDTDIIADILIKNGYKILCISYGYQNLMDLIIYEEV